MRMKRFSRKDHLTLSYSLLISNFREKKPLDPLFYVSWSENFLKLEEHYLRFVYQGQKQIEIHGLGVAGKVSKPYLLLFW